VTFIMDHSTYANADGLRIVLVEGDLIEARRIARLFARRRHPRFAVEHAGSLADGERAILGSRPDLVLLDLDLPDSRGLDALHRVREAHAQVPIVVLTAQEAQETGIAAMDEGAQDYLVKTAMDEELLARTVQAVISHERLLQQHRSDSLRLARGERSDIVGRMALSLVHDFNNLLTVIQNNAAVLRKSVERQQSATERVDAIDASVQRGVTLCRQIVSYCKAGAAPVVTFDLNVLVVNMLSLLERVVQDTTHVVYLRGAESVYVCAEHAQLEQVIVNLVLNAEDSLDSGGHIMIETRNVSAEQAPFEPDVILPRRAFGALFVTDDGCGMDAVTQSHIFEEFFSTKQHGTGLGLSIVSNVVHEAGGAIAVDSDLGRGSRFRIYLPATSDAEDSITPRTH
jgi:two-component system cell cycle sensor histidine kinase/response regulator CckA